MRRGYSRENYLELIDLIRTAIPGVALSSDFIAGFCGETEKDHEDTLSLLDLVKYDHAFLFAYSQRDQTHAARQFPDDVPDDVKQRRLQQLIELFLKRATEKNQGEIGGNHLVLVDGTSRRSPHHWVGRSDTNKKVIFPKTDLLSNLASISNLSASPSQPLESVKVGDYVIVNINGASSSSLRGVPIAKSSIPEFAASQELLALIPSIMPHLPHIRLESQIKA
eukprot:TRINITY_DN691_c0_g1_i2.p1 TRINITY_DN691_c0_g1~~TRINITY_DN691_c0_g1_i2.p1  ORF type:complete len:223 (-),score=19.38 TRINITY_DN691_c0_g1_i2:21-689(-)